MKKSALLCAAVTAAGLALAAGAPAMAQSIQVFPSVTYTEDATNGWIGSIPTSSPAINVASDGESNFDPFGAGFDTSDGIQLNSNWTPDPAYAASFAPGYWTQLPGSYTWVLPACNPTGCENATIYEPVGKWDFPGAQWAAGTQSIRLIEPDGSFSDYIQAANENGMATITFVSDGVPEPATWAMLILGVGLIGFAARTRREAAAVTA